MTLDCLLKLTSPAKLDRDKGITALQGYLNSCSADEMREIESNILDLLRERSSSWEIPHGALIAAKYSIVYPMTSEMFVTAVTKETPTFLDHSEFRVRTVAGEVMGALCKLSGPDIYKMHKPLILDGIRDNLNRDLGLTPDHEQVPNYSQALIRDAITVRDASQIFHESAGWKSLETWMKCLQSVIDGCGSSFNPYVDQTLLDLLFLSLSHSNRFVRETGFYVLASLVSCSESNATLSSGSNSIHRYGDQFTEYISKGLADNWSMVRLAASVAARNFLKSFPSLAARGPFLSTLLPRMCLNRYYVAEGVRNYSQETWREICGERGKELVEQHIDSVVNYYIDQTKAENHAVREAACVCIAELGNKISAIKLSPHVWQLLDILLVCFNDDSWPVRDAACVACGNFVKCFPEESRSSLTALFPLFYINLQDTISSVRQGAAQALANVIRAYGRECSVQVLDKIREGLLGVANQPSESERYSGLDLGVATYGVVKRLRDNDMDLHSGQQMYSCGSLAPKMGSGRIGGGGGCMDHLFRKPSEQWELADGCVNLVAELSGLTELSENVSSLLPLVVQAASYRHYTHHVVLLATLCNRLPDIAKGLGKRNFKRHLETFFDSIFYSLSCDNDLASSGASHCVKELATFLGPGILRGRIELHNPQLLRQFDSTLSSIL